MFLFYKYLLYKSPIFQPLVFKLWMKTSQVKLALTRVNKK